MKRWLGRLVVVGWCSLPVVTQAAPSGGQVSAGSGSIAQSGALTTITQQSDRLAIDWQQFNIGAQETVTFQQPSRSSIALNRVLGQSPSEILGKLNANGQVFLLNPNGVLFGQSAQVNVGGLVASSLNLSNSDFLAGRFQFDGNSQAQINNQGLLQSAAGGYVALLGASVDNSGSIVTPQGNTSLAAGQAVTLQLDNGSLVGLTVDKGAVAALVNNGGLIQAADGQVLLTAKAADQLSRAVVNHSGVIEAGSVSGDGGSVRLLAAGGQLDVSGNIDATGKHAGGQVQLLADQDLLIKDAAQIDASGDMAGGSIRVGGGIQGGENLMQAQRTFVAPDARLFADAREAGKGGDIAVWSQANTVVAGGLYARGGSRGGDGGFIETSSLGSLTVTTAADVSAVAGRGGNWLLDPNNLRIVAGSDNTNINAASPFATTDDGAELGVDLIVAGLKNGDVTISTAAAGANTEQGDISVEAGFSFDGTGGATTQTAGKLTLDAAGNIHLNSGVQLAGSGSYALSVDMNAGGSINLEGGTILANGGEVTLAANGGGVTLGDISANQLAVVAAGDITQTAGTLLLSGAASFDAGSFDINLGNLNDFGGAVTLAGKQVTLVDMNALSLGAVTATDLTATSNGSLLLGQAQLGGKLTLATNGGQVMQTGALTVAGDTSIDAGNGTIDLSNTANDFSAKVSLTAGEVALVDKNALTLGDLDTGKLTLTSHGDLNLGQGQIGDQLVANSNGHDLLQTSALNVAGQVQLTATGASVLLDNTGNDLGTDVTLTAANATLTDADGLVVSSATTSGDLTLTANAGSLAEGGTPTAPGAMSLGLIDVQGALQISSKGGNIIQTAALTAAQDVTLAAESGSILLTNAGNEVGGTLNVAGGNSELAVVDALVLGTLEVANLTVNTHGNLTLGTGNVSGQLNANSDNHQITQGAGGLRVGGIADLNAGSANITLDQSANNFAARVNLTGQQLTITDANSLLLGGINSQALTATSSGQLTLDTTQLSGNLVLTSHGGSVMQSGAWTIGGSSTIDAAGGSVQLLNANNDFVGVLNLTSGTTHVTDANALTLGTLDTNGLFVTANNGELNLGQGQVDGTLNATSYRGDIVQTAGLTVTGSSQLDADYNDIDLSHANNDFQGGVRLVGNVTQLVDANALMLDSISTGQLTVTSHGALNLGYGQVSGKLDASSNGGAISQANSLIVTLGSNLNAGTGQILLNNNLNDFRGTVTLTGGNTQLVDRSALELGTLATGNLAVSSTGKLVLGVGSVNGTLQANSHGGAISQSGALSVSGTSSIDAGAASILLDNTGNQFAAAVSLANQGSSDVLLDNGGHALKLGQLSLGSGALSLQNYGISPLLLTQDIATSGGVVNLDGAVQLGAAHIGIMTTLNGAAGADIHVGGDINGQAAGANGLTVDAGSTGQVALAGSLGNQVQLADVAVSGKQVELGGSLDMSGDLLLHSDADLVQQADWVVAGGASLDVGAHAITLLQAGNDFAGSLSLAAADAQLNDSNALTLGVLATGNLTVTSDGALNLGSGSVNGVLVVDSQNGDLSQTSALQVSGDAQLHAGNILLDQANNDFAGKLNMQAGNVDIQDQNALQLGQLTLADLSVTAGGDLNLGQGNIAGALSASAAGNISQTAALVVTGASDLTISGGQHDVLLTAAGNDFGGQPLTLNAASGAGIDSFQLADSNAAALFPQLTALPINLLLDYSQAALIVPSLTLAGYLDLRAAQGITLGGVVATGAGQHYRNALTLSADTSLSSSAGDLLFDGSIDGAHVLSVNSAGHVVLTQAAGAQSALTGLALTGASVNVAGLQVDGDLTIDSHADITQGAAFEVSGNANFSATAHAIALTNADNHFAGAVSLSNGGAQSVALVNDGLLTLDQIHVGSGNLSLSGNGISQTAASNIMQAPGAAAVTLDAGAGALNLAGGFNNFIGTLSLSAAAGVTLVGQYDLSLAQVNSSQGDVLLTAGNYLTLENGASVEGGEIELVAGRAFKNRASSSALAARDAWRVWSASPDDDRVGGLDYAFKQYNAHYGVDAAQGAGNGLLYTYAPVLNVQLTGSVSKVYDGTTTASLNANNLLVSGVYDDDVVSVAAAAASYADADVGSNKQISANGFTVVANDGDADVYGYQIAAVAPAAIGEITPATLSYVADPVTRLYGAPNPVLTGSVSGFVSGETLATATHGTLVFSATTGVLSDIGHYAIEGSGLTAGNYVFVQAPGNAVALEVRAPNPLQGTALMPGYSAAQGSAISAQQQMQLPPSAPSSSADSQLIETGTAQTIPAQLSAL